MGVRKRQKIKKRGGGAVHDRRRGGYLDPEDQYVHDPAKPTLVEIARTWGLHKNTVERRSSDHDWTRKREDFWRKVRAKHEEEMAEESAQLIAKANREHIKTGQAYRGAAGTVLEKLYKRLQAEGGDKELKLGEGLRVSTQMMKAGVDVERKGLGLADTTVYVQNTREMASKMVAVLERVLQGHPDLLEEAVNGVADLLAESEDELAEVAAGVGRGE